MFLSIAPMMLLQSYIIIFKIPNANLTLGEAATTAVFLNRV